MTAELVGTTARLNNALRRLGSGWAIFVEASRVPHSIIRAAGSQMPSPPSSTLSGVSNSNRTASISRAFITSLWSGCRPRKTASRAEAWLYEGSSREGVDAKELLKGFTDRTDRLLQLVEGFVPEVFWLDDEETLTYLHACVSSKRHRVRRPEVPMYLDALLADEPLTGGLEPRLGSHHLRTLTIIGFPASTVPGILDDLNLAFSYRWVTRAIMLEPACLCLTHAFCSCGTARPLRADIMAYNGTGSGRTACKCGRACRCRRPHARHVAMRRTGLCATCTPTKGQQAIREFTRALRDRTGNLPPMPSVFPDYFAPIARNQPEGRELTMARWGMPSPAFALKGKSCDPGVTNVRNVASPHCRRWLGIENRCVVPFTSFSENEVLPDGSRPPVWFAFDESRPLAFFAGIWTRWTSVRKVKEGEAANDIFAFLTTEPNKEVGAIHPKAMPVILTTREDIDVWMNAPPAEALKLQRPLPDNTLKIVARGEKKDEGGLAA